MRISRIGLGGLLAGSWKPSWNQHEEAESIRAIQEAVELGVNWIDTSPFYGFGRSEELIGKTLKLLSKKPFVFTKCGIRWNENSEIVPNLTVESVREEVEMSLKRLCIEEIDLYQIHWPKPEEYIEEAWETMSTLIREGKIRYIGVSNLNTDQMDRLSRIAPITSLQPQYNAITRSVENDILPYCLKSGIGVIVYSPMASGLLTGKMTRGRIANMESDDLRRDNWKFKEPDLSKNLKITDMMEEIANEKGCNTAEVAIAWTLKNPSVTGAIAGMRNRSQVADIINCTEIELSDNDMNRIATSS